MPPLPRSRKGNERPTQVSAGFSSRRMARRSQRSHRLEMETAGVQPLGKPGKVDK